MTPQARASAAIEVLADIEARKRPASEALKDWGLSHRFAGSGDRAAIGNLVFDCLRKRASAAYAMRGADAARAIAERNLRCKTEHFAEVFLDGREFNLSLLDGPSGPAVLPIAEIVFDGFAGAPRIVGYDAKWTPDSAAYIGTPRRFGLEAENPELAAKLASLARACWQLFALTGYARVDFRLDAQGEPAILEVNMNPCLSPDAGYAAAAKEAGYLYEAMATA